jgi:hypothetical protein
MQRYVYGCISYSMVHSVSIHPSVPFMMVKVWRPLNSFMGRKHSYFAGKCNRLLSVIFCSVYMRSPGLFYLSFLSMTSTLFCAQRLSFCIDMIRVTSCSRTIRCGKFGNGLLANVMERFMEKSHCFRPSSCLMTARRA